MIRSLKGVVCYDVFDCTEARAHWIGWSKVSVTMGSAASAVVPRLQASNRGISAAECCMESFEMPISPIPAVEKADQGLQPTRVCAFDAEEWEKAFGQMTRDLARNCSQSQESQN